VRIPDSPAAVSRINTEQTGNGCHPLDDDKSGKEFARCDEPEDLPPRYLPLHKGSSWVRSGEKQYK